MRTRRSPRNQELLWRALTPPTTAATPAEPDTRCWQCVSYSQTGRSSGACALTGRKVRNTSQRPCFSARHTSPLPRPAERPDVAGLEPCDLTRDETWPRYRLEPEPEETSE